LKIKAFLKFSLSRALFSKLQLLVARSGGIACIDKGEGKENTQGGQAVSEKVEKGGKVVS
jgi:hypothetical protein